jgi:hypothetical protein
MSRVVSWLVAGALAAAVLTVARPARAEAEAAKCQIFEIKAKNTKGGKIDPALRPIASKLKKPPFSSWNTFESMAHHDETAVRMKAFELELVPGGKMSLLYRDQIQAEGKKPRLRISLTLDDKSGKRLLDATIKLDSGDWYLIGGESLPGDATYILATSCATE